MIAIVVFLIITFGFLIQTTILAEFFLLRGTPDLVMLVLIVLAFYEKDNLFWVAVVYCGALVGYASEIPLILPIFEYLSVVVFIRYMERFIWQSPILLLFISVILGSVLIFVIDYIYIFVISSPLDISVSLGEAFNLVILPGTILNVILSLPIYGFVGELIKTFSAQEVSL